MMHQLPSPHIEKRFPILASFGPLGGTFLEILDLVEDIRDNGFRLLSVCSKIQVLRVLEQSQGLSFGDALQVKILLGLRSWLSRPYCAL